MFIDFPSDFSPPDNVEIAEFSSVVNWFDNGVLFIYAKPDIQHTLDEAKKQVAFIEEANRNKRGSVFIDVRKAPSMSIDVRNYYNSGSGMDNVKGICFLISSPITMIVGNIYLYFVNQKVKTKMVNTTSFGLEWLETL